MRRFRNILITITIIITELVIAGHGQAATLKQPRSQTYQVTYINANAYQTKHQYALFNRAGRVAYVNVEDFDQSGNPFVDSKATKEQARAPQLLQRYVSSATALNRVATQRGFQVRANHRVRIHNQLITQSATGKVSQVTSTGFTITYPTKSKVPYATVQFKLAPDKYQVKH
ncbi:hypothetical protein [Limosilactobacillus sp.]|uniref:hypothetical protein n=1 Tax=Limosilactobacillus sp. TaxID=2773925 RepID=UPI0025C002CA|nr:hypothetical protein [Limosilactobacillus sp.]MCH3921568.1 hypothetical protein [Limosilactobacillus sp.]MCH3928339.1 hypothetical protein [Limosilactobacillus sp.]